MLKRMKGNPRGVLVAVLISTHRMEEVTASCTRVIVLDRGKVVADDTPARLAANYPDGLDGAFRALTRGEG